MLDPKHVSNAFKVAIINPIKMLKARPVFPPLHLAAPP